MEKIKYKLNKFAIWLYNKTTVFPESGIRFKLYTEVSGKTLQIETHVTTQMIDISLNPLFHEVQSMTAKLLESASERIREDITKKVLYGEKIISQSMAPYLFRI